MFSGVAGRYDFANHLLSGGMDFLWRWRLARMVSECEPATVVDLATGSGDVALAIAGATKPPPEIVGIDFCEPMLEIARRKKDRASGITDPQRISFRHGDILDLPLSDGFADVVTIAFGLRNLEDRARGLNEMHRILSPSAGTLLVLEFSQPVRCLRSLYYAYLTYILPHIAGLATGHPDAYRYLAGSIAGFPRHEDVTEELRGAGFQDITTHRMCGGIVCIHRGVRRD